MLCIWMSEPIVCPITCIRRPYAGDWTNYRIKDYDYSQIDYLRYGGDGKEIIL